MREVKNNGCLEIALKEFLIVLFPQKCIRILLNGQSLKSQYPADHCGETH